MRNLKAVSFLYFEIKTPTHSHIHIVTTSCINNKRSIHVCSYIYIDTHGCTNEFATNTFHTQPLTPSFACNINESSSSL